MKIVTLSTEEISYLQRLLKEHIEYYRLLAGSSKCLLENREKQKFIEILWSKLQT